MLTADHVARAIIAACRETGEDPIAVASGQEGIFRSRHYAMWALCRVFGRKLAPTTVARAVGCPGNPRSFYYNSRTNAFPGGGSQRGARWWNAAAFERIVAAINVPIPEAKPEPPPFKAGPLPPVQYRPPPGTVAQVLEDDEDDDRPVFDRGRIGGERRKAQPPMQSKQAIWDELREAVRNTAKMTPPPEE